MDLGDETRRKRDTVGLPATASRRPTAILLPVTTARALSGTRTDRVRARLAAAVTLVVLVTGCTTTPQPDETVRTPTATATPTATVAPVTPTPSQAPPEPSPSTTPEPAALVPLTADQVGDLAIGAPVTVAEVEALLGPMDSVAAELADCGAPHLDYATSGALSVRAPHPTRA